MTFSNDLFSYTSFIDYGIQESFLNSINEDAQIGRDEMIDIFVSAQDDGFIDQYEINDIQNIINQADFTVTADYSWYSYIDIDILSQKVLNSVFDGMSDYQLEYAIDKFFYGTVRPELLDEHTYDYSYVDQSDKPLFADGAETYDIDQGEVGNCYLLASFAAVADTNSTIIEDMFIDNYDGSYSVRYYINGEETYVTVDSALPTDSYGNQAYASADQELWVALAEKAYAQLNEEGVLNQDYAANSYDAIAGGFPSDSLAHITGNSFSLEYISDVNYLINSWYDGETIVLSTFESPQSSSVVGNHAYAVTDYNSSSNEFSLFNPWGHNHLSVSASSLQGNFDYWYHGFA